MDILTILNDYQGVVACIAIVVAVLIYIAGKIGESRLNYRKRIHLLQALKKELSWEVGLLTDIVQDENEDLPHYYDPTRANFKGHNDVLVYALTRGQSVLRPNEQLFDALIRTNDALGYYNQQVQEQHDCRFSAPQLLGIATDMYRRDPQVLKKWMCDPSARPENIKYFLEELRLRNWAINSGKKCRLAPALVDVYRQIDLELNRLTQGRKWWHFWKAKLNRDDKQF